MKKLLVIAAIVAASTCSAQVCQNIQCSNPVTLSGPLNNTTFNSSTCFQGNGNITGSVNWNNWNYLTFDGDINVNQAINFQNGPKKVYISGTAKVKINGTVSMDNQDTIFVKDNGQLEITSIPITNNSYTNVIVKGRNSVLKIFGVVYNNIVNDTLRNNPINPTNVLVIINCNPNALPIDTVNHSVKPPIVKTTKAWYNDYVQIFAIDGTLIYKGLFNANKVPKNTLLVIRYGYNVYKVCFN